MTLKINRQTIFKRCLKALCPNCGHSKIAHSWIVIHEKCPECSMPIKRGNGFYIGPICLNYGVIAFGIISPLLILGFSKMIPFAWTLSLSVLFSFTLPILFITYAFPKNFMKIDLKIQTICYLMKTNASKPESYYSLIA